MSSTAKPSVELRPEDFTHRFVTFRGLRMHLVSEGKENAPLVVLLHGFPEFWHSWRYQIEPLVNAGYHVVVPDQRGYNLTDKFGPYDLLTLTDDIAGLIETLGYAQASAVIGHDWGGAVTWTFAARYPEMTNRVVVCNMPHPWAVTHAFRERYWPQLMRSWYMGFFQVPLLPEAMLSANDFEMLANSIKNTAHGTITDAELFYFKQAWAQPMALTAMLGWYRALRDQRRLRGADLTVRRPSLLIWGDADFALTTQTAEWTRRYVPNLRIDYIPGASHWVQQERPDEVNRHMLDFLEPAQSQAAP